MSSDDSTALGQFITQLNQAWHAAGQPSFNQLEALSIQLAQASRGQEVELEVLARSTTHQILDGQRVHAPKWPWVLSYIHVLWAAARKAGISPEKIGTIEDWKQRHEAASSVRPAGPDRDGAGGGQANITGDDREPRPPASAVLLPDGTASEEENARLDMFRRLLRREGGPQWWDEYDDDAVPGWMAIYLYLESNATRIRMFAPGLIPSLLQAEAYIHAVVSRNNPEASAGQIDRLIELQLRRQERLRRRAECKLWVIVEEAALRDERVSRPARRAQLGHLIEMADVRNVSIGILASSSTDDGSMMKEPVSIFRFAEPKSDDVVCVELSPTEGQFRYRREDTNRCQRLMEILAIRSSATPKEVKDLLWRILRET